MRRNLWTSLYGNYWVSEMMADVGYETAQSWRWTGSWTWQASLITVASTVGENQFLVSIFIRLDLHGSSFFIEMISWFCSMWHHLPRDTLPTSTQRDWMHPTFGGWNQPNSRFWWHNWWNALNFSGISSENGCVNTITGVLDRSAQLCERVLAPIAIYLGLHIETMPTQQSICPRISFGHDVSDK